MAETHNVLLIVLPQQSHINPTLQLAKRLANLGVRVTYMTTVSAINRISKGSVIEGISFTSFPDGNLKDNLDENIYEMERCGSQALREFITATTKEGTVFTHLIYSFLFPWAASVAREFHIPTTFLWIQPASIFAIYYQYHMEGYGDFIRKNIDDPSFSVELRGLPPLKSDDLPSFLLLSSNRLQSAIPITRRHIEVLNEETKPKVLVNTLDALEPEALKAIQNYNMVGIGPLIPSAFLDGKTLPDTSFGGDLFEGTKHYTQWLNSKPENSVVYASFGSLAVLEKAQKEAIAQGLLATGYPFLWVIRDSGEEEKEEEKLSCKEELEKQGMIVPWCSQVEILSHPSVGCFLTHCGWNSTLESLASGVPMVTFPQWGDQLTNSKLVQDVWKTGVRMKKNEEGRVESDEIKRCLELVMGSEEMKLNAKIWKNLAREANMEGGYSDENLKAFVNDLGKTSSS